MIINNLQLLIEILIVIFQELVLQNKKYFKDFWVKWLELKLKIKSLKYYNRNKNNLNWQRRISLR